MNILLGEVSSYKAIVIAKYLKKNYEDITIYTYDKKKHSNYVRTKYSDQHFYININYFGSELQMIIKKYKIDFFFPVINNSISIILKDKKKYGDTLNYVDDIHMFNTLNDKFKLQDLALQLGVKAPNTFDSLESASIPFVVKPPNLSSAVGVRYVFSENDRAKLKVKYKDCIIQEYIKGTGVGYSFYCKKGVIAHGYGHKRLSEFPVKGGASTYRTYYHNNLMHDMASIIVEHLNYTGFAMFEFKLTKDGQLYLLEVNPRIWGSINQGMADGNVNYFEEILGPATKNIEKHHKSITTYIPLIYASLLGYIFRLKFKPVYRFFISNIFRNKSDVGLFDDPLGYTSTILRKLI